jgi:Domain of unknown function (DUF4259)
MQVERLIMGAWGYLAFDNDTTNDWADNLDTVDNLSLVESAFDELEDVGDDYLEADIASEALGACEVIARLLGNPGYKNTYTEKVDRWVATHQLKPSTELVNRASAALERILSDNSELWELCMENAEGDKNNDWHKVMEDLHKRLQVRTQSL